MLPRRVVAPFRDRSHAGRELAARLGHHRGADTVVLALPRGGVPVGYEVATALGAPLDVFLVRKLGTPGHEELAMGAIASGGVTLLHQPVLDTLVIGQAAIDRAIERERAELRRREHAYRGNRGAPDLAGRTVIVVDDGLATGSTMRAAVQAIGQADPGHLVVAVPVASRSTCDSLLEIVDEVVCAAFPLPFYAVGQGYDDFSQTTDEEVIRLLAAAPAP